MTDNEIIKSLECCVNGGICKECPINPHYGNYGYCTSLAIKAALDLINRQKAEIERLNHIRAEMSKEIDIWKDIAKRETGYVELARTEAIKEFAERLKKRTRKFTEYDDGGWDFTQYVVVVEDIDNLTKEMTEGCKT